MKNQFAKGVYVLMFLAFSAIPLALIVQNFDHDDLVHRLISLALTTFIVFFAKWTLLDGFRAIDRQKPGEATKTSKKRP